MIQANELRIGNYVLKDGRYRKVEAISIPYNHLLSLKNNALLERVEFDDVQPIFLTEEILLNCGFFKCSLTENNYETKGMRVWKCEEMFLCDKNGVHIKYLHQLENLYFALTGEELTIKL